MDLQEYDYEANAADVDLEQVTSSARNAKILQRLRDGDRQLTCLQLGHRNVSDFIISEGDDLGWLGYFIGNSQHLESLIMWSMPEGEGGEQQIDAFVQGIAQNKSIREVFIGPRIDDIPRAAIVTAASNYSQLERLWIKCNGSFGPNSHSALGNLLELGVCSLRRLCLWGNGINDDVISSFVNGFKSISASLKVLVLSASSIGNEGLMAVVAGLANATSLKKLHLSENDFSLAAEGLSSLSACLRSSPMALEHLNLSFCQINDQGLQAFAQGSGIHCRELDLRGNRSITATGLSCLSNSLQSKYCQVEILNLRNIPSAIGNDGAKALARGLAHNTSLRILRLGSSLNNDTVPPARWLAFSNALCDPSSVNSTYRSNHTIHKIICDGSNASISRPEDIDLYLRLNEQHPKHAPMCKILMKHTHLDMQAFLKYDLKLLPLSITWFEQAKICTTLNVQLPAAEGLVNGLVERRIVEESDKEFESRVLSAMYEFVHGMSMQVMGSRNLLELAAAYDEKFAKIEEGHKMDLEQRDSMNAQLQEENARLELENKRLREIVESAKVQLRAENARLEHENKAIRDENMRSGQRELKNIVEIARLEHEKKRIVEEKTKRDRENEQLRAKIARLESEKEGIEGQRYREKMQLREEITRLENENERRLVQFFCFSAFLLECLRRAWGFE